MKSERPLNALEAVFASCNVRFALLVVFDSGEASVELEEMKKKAQAALQSSQLGHLSLVQNEEDEWSLVATENAVAKVVTREIEDSQIDIKDYGTILHEIVHKETTAPAAKGALSVQVLKCRSSSSWAGLLLNGNHAMVDGRSLTHLMGLATGMNDPASPKVARIINLPDWKDLVEDATTSNWQGDPPFLMGQHRMLTAKELCHEHSSDGGDSFLFELSGEIITAIRQVLKRDDSGATISGLLAAVMMHSLAMEYQWGEPRDVGISMLVDLRPYLPRKDLEEIPQVHGSVTLIESSDRLNISIDDSSGAVIVASSILELAASLTSQLKRRIERGEAHRNAMALTSGNFSSSGPPATLELSNLGVCRLPEGAKMYTAQRFDGYDGVSCMVHSESCKSGFMRWNVSVGQGLDASLIHRVFNRALNMCHELSYDTIVDTQINEGAL